MIQPLKSVDLDLNNPVFQKNLFALTRDNQLNVLGTLRKLSPMTWEQVYADQGLKWELIQSRNGPHGQRLYSFRAGISLRGLAWREGNWLRLLSLHPGHDSAY